MLYTHCSPALTSPSHEEHYISMIKHNRPHPDLGTEDDHHETIQQQGGRCCHLSITLEDRVSAVRPRPAGEGLVLLRNACQLQVAGLSGAPGGVGASDHQHPSSPANRPRALRQQARNRWLDML